MDEVKNLVSRAAQAERAEDASLFAQAALNCARALLTLGSVTSDAPQPKTKTMEVVKFWYDHPSDRKQKSVFAARRLFDVEDVSDVDINCHLEELWNVMVGQ
jgi:hypothetical protein